MAVFASYSWASYRVHYEYLLQAISTLSSSVVSGLHLFARTTITKGSDALMYVEEDLHLIQGFMHQAGTRAVADLIRTQSGEVEVYQVPRRPEIQASPAVYPTVVRMQHHTSPPLAWVAIAVLWMSALIGLVIWVVRWLASAATTAVVGHSGAVVVLMGLAVLAVVVLAGRRKTSKAACSGAHCGGCDR